MPRRAGPPPHRVHALNTFLSVAVFGANFQGPLSAIAVPAYPHTGVSAWLLLEVGWGGVSFCCWGSPVSLSPQQGWLSRRVSTQVISGNSLLGTLRLPIRIIHEVRLLVQQPLRGPQEGLWPARADLQKQSIAPQDLGQDSRSCAHN